MPLFQYRGRSARGALVSGRMEGETVDSIASALLSGGVTPVEINAAAESKSFDVHAAFQALGFGKPRTADLVLFSRQMYTITKSGLPLLRGLRSLVTTTHNRVLRTALQDMLSALEAGRDLASCFARHPQIFPALYVSVIRIGETTGTLDASFLRLSEYLLQDQELQDRVRGAMRYPIIVTCVIGIAIAVLTTFVIPHFAPLFKVLGDDIPLPTRIIMGVSQVVQTHWAAMLGTTAATILGVRRYISQEAGRYQWHRLKLRLPVFGPLAHQATLARITRSLAISLKAGMPMIQTLTLIARAAGNDYMTERIGRLKTGVERGEPLSRAAANVGMFPPLVLQMVEVGEETGELTELLEEISGYYAREVDASLKNLSAAIEPILIVTVGAMVLLLALGVFLPMWEMISKTSATG